MTHSEESLISAITISQTKVEKLKAEWQNKLELYEQLVPDKQSRELCNEAISKEYNRKIKLEKEKEQSLNEKLELLQEKNIRKRRHVETVARRQRRQEVVANSDSSERFECSSNDESSEDESFDNESSDGEISEGESFDNDRSYSESFHHERSENEDDSSDQEFQSDNKVQPISSNDGNDIQHENEKGVEIIEINDTFDDDDENDSHRDDDDDDVLESNRNNDMNTHVTDNDSESCTCHDSEDHNSSTMSINHGEQGRNELSDLEDEGYQDTSMNQENDQSIDSRLESGENSSDDEDSFDYNDDDDDEDSISKEVRNEQVTRIKESKLEMILQGFRGDPALHLHGRESNRQTNIEATKRKFDPDSVNYQGRTFNKNQCYHMSSKDAMMGIYAFLNENTARCILIVKFEDTILGMEDIDSKYTADFPSQYVQVFNHIHEISLSELEHRSDVQIIPDLIYEPQSLGSWTSFGYFYDRKKIKIIREKTDVRSIEIFAGPGGSLQGYHANDFKTVLAVEKDEASVNTLRANNPSLDDKIFHGCVRDFIRNYISGALKHILGRIDHVHLSPPCQGFSTANRNTELSESDKENNDLSLLTIDIIRMTKCTTAVFENVNGMWRRKNIHYMIKIVTELLKMGYQVRCAELQACNYGDPQKRPRFFMFISKKGVPIANIPRSKHGEDPHLLPFFTVKQAFCDLKDDGTILNMQGKSTSVRPGMHGVVRLEADSIAPAIRANSIPPYHYEEDRCINVREAATLQGFPTDYIFHGSITEQYRQAGNSIPRKTITAVAREIKEVQQYEYYDDENCIL
ncbi:hypothetical protein CTEN210_03824 [Chaetoceros tenuissimus]|uniref:DNA (cytosine-5-)-methyltransferase n=1 Tax=Chaetoceros tenuissimus TaxID=426638 RepID=A0AAD3CKI9_9STRA|nr:hypothetical protein CTEN210_03824 [Chaetoceros tenuissimus]